MLVHILSKSKIIACNVCVQNFDYKSKNEELNILVMVTLLLSAGNLYSTHVFPWT